MHVDMHDSAAFLEASAAALATLRADAAGLATIDLIAERVASAFGAGNKLLLCGNGGSAADAQHIAAEFVVRLAEERPSLPALALTTDSSILTASGNDYGYEQVFARQVAGLGRPGDVLIGLSTSGRSPNVRHALAAARLHGLLAVGLTGRAGADAFGSECDLVLAAPSDTTAIIQQVHMTVGHVICAKVERMMFAEHPASRIPSASRRSRRV